MRIINKMKKTMLVLAASLFCANIAFADTQTVYSWESPEGTPAETGGTMVYTNGDGERLNYSNAGYHTICLNGKSGQIGDAEASANAGHMVLTLDEALKTGDVISITAYRNKNAEGKAASIYFLFENGAVWKDTNTFVNICADDADEDYDDDGATPNTVTWTITDAEAGSKTLKLTRNSAGTNLFITKMTITREVEDAPAGGSEGEGELATEIVPLTADMFMAWDGVGADAKSTGAATPEMGIGKELGGGAMVYGYGTVDPLAYADLTGYEKIVIEGTPGMVIRVLMNRELGGEPGSFNGALVEVKPAIAEDGKAEVDLTSYDYVHVNAMKTDWGSATGTVTAINLVKTGGDAVDTELVAAVDSLKSLIAEAEAWKAELNPEDEMHAQVIPMLEQMIPAAQAVVDEPASLEAVNNMIFDVYAALGTYKPMVEQYDAKVAASAALEAAKALLATYTEYTDEAGFAAAIAAVENALVDINMGMVTLPELNAAVEAMKAAQEAFVTENTPAEGATETVPLTADMFMAWDSATEPTTGTAAGCALVLNESTGLPYGDGNVYYLNYADLSEYLKLVVTVSEGTPRFLFNRTVDNGAYNTDESQSLLLEIPKSGEWTDRFWTVEGNVYTVDLAKIVADKGFAHLHCIKGANWANVKVTSMELVKAVEEPAAEVVVAADFEDGNIPFFSWHSNTRTVVDGVLEIAVPEVTNAWDQQMAYDNSFEYEATYTMKFKVKGSAAGSISANFQVTTDGYKDAGNFGAIEFGTEWTEFESSVTVSQKAADRLIFNLGSFAGTVYVDDFVLTVVRPEAGEPEVWTNILTNSDLEGKETVSFVSVENDDFVRGAAEILDGVGKDGSRGIKVKSFAGATNDWDAQFWIVMPQVLPAGTEYRVSFDYRASSAVTVGTQAHANPSEYIHYDMIGSPAFTTEWQHYEKSGVISAQQAGDPNTFKSIAFNLAVDKANDVEFFFDNIVFEVCNFVPYVPSIAYLCGATETTEAIYTALVNAGYKVTALNYDDVTLTEEIVATDFVGKYDAVVLAGNTGSGTNLAKTANLLLGKVNVLSTKAFWYKHYGTNGGNPGTAETPSLGLVKTVAEHPIFAGIEGAEFAVFNDMGKESGRYLQSNGQFADNTPAQKALATTNGADCIGEAWVDGKGYVIIPVDGIQPEGYLTAAGEALFVNALDYLLAGTEYVEPTIDVTSITLDQTAVELLEGATVTLVATVAPENATDKTITWTTSNEAVATVADGVVTAVAAGEAVITAQAGNVTATCTITIKADGIEVIGIESTLTGDIYDLSGRLVKKNATSTEGLQKGIYLINGKKVAVK